MGIGPWKALRIWSISSSKDWFFSLGKQSCGIHESWWNPQIRTMPRQSWTKVKLILYTIWIINDYIIVVLPIDPFQFETAPPVEIKFRHKKHTTSETLLVGFLGDVSGDHNWKQYSPRHAAISQKLWQRRWFAFNCTCTHTHTPLNQEGPERSC